MQHIFGVCLVHMFPWRGYACLCAAHMCDYPVHAVCIWILGTSYFHGEGTALHATCLGYIHMSIAGFRGFSVAAYDAIEDVA